jgi:hypothetical protein
VLRAYIRIILITAIVALEACSPATSQPPRAPAGPACSTESGDTANDARDSLGRFDGAREVRAWIDMWNRFDLDRVDALFLRDARLTYFSSERPGLISGIDALRQHHRGFGFAPGGADRGSRLWLEAVQAHTYGGVVVVTATWLFQRAGAGAAQRGPVTLILVNEGGACRIAHAHFANDPPTKPAPAKEARRGPAPITATSD